MSQAAAGEPQDQLSAEEAKMLIQAIEEAEREEAEDQAPTRLPNS